MKKTDKLVFCLIIIFLGAGFVLSGCAAPNSGKVSGGDKEDVSEKCKTDAECGISHCSVKRDKATNVSCVDGKCTETVKNCTTDEICLVDSKGAECVNKKLLGETPRPSISCDANAGILRTTGSNPFSIFGATCLDDCPEGYVCNAATCICEDPPSNPPPVCPAPVFRPYAPDIAFDGATYDFSQTFDLFFGGLGKLENPTELVNIPAFLNDPTAVNIFPFPDEQFAVLLPDEPMGVYCANPHYDADRALTISEKWVSRPSGEQDVCSYGDSDVWDGVLTVCKQDLYEWYSSFSMGALDFFNFINFLPPVNPEIFEDKETPDEEALGGEDPDKEAQGGEDPGEEAPKKAVEPIPSEVEDELIQSPPPDISKVKIYSTPTCPYCIRAKQWLKDNNIEYEDFDVSQNEENRNTLKEKTGRTAVPVIEVGNEIVIGFDKNRLAELLEVE